MSLGRIGARAVLVTALATVSMAVATGTASASSQQSAKACQKDGWRNLKTQSGGGFASAGECVSYLAKGGVLAANLEVHIRFETPHCFGLEPFSPCLSATVAGFGLKPFTLVFAEISGEGGGVRGSRETDELGVLLPSTFVGVGCPNSGVTATAEATLASGVPITATATEPSSC
jgi:hypothetical protein